METLEQLKEIVKNAPDGVNKDKLSIDRSGRYWFVDGDFNYVASDGELCWTDIEHKPDDFPLRSLSDIKLIIELMEANKEAKKGALLSLKEAIEPDGLINSDAGLKTIRTIQNAIDKIVSHL